MKVKNILKVILFSIIFIPTCVFADEDINVDNNRVKVSETVKYYKTVYRGSSASLMSIDNNLLNNLTTTYEISEEEYNNSNDELNATVETEYKRLTTTIYSYYNYYRYEVNLHWKNMPSVRKYDVIAIGHYQSVKKVGTADFSCNYCYVGGGCSTSYGYHENVISSGTGVSFPLPTGNLRSLDIFMAIDVTKNTNSTIISQQAVGDYAHGTSNFLTQNIANKHNVFTTGISFYDGAGSYFDDTPIAPANLSCNW